MKLIIDIIWILLNIYIIYISVVSTYHNFMIGDTSRAILQTIVIIGFIILMMFIIIKEMFPEFKKMYHLYRKRGKEE